MYLIFTPTVKENCTRLQPTGRDLSGEGELDTRGTLTDGARSLRRSEETDSKEGKKSLFIIISSYMHADIDCVCVCVCVCVYIYIYIYVVCG